MSYPPDLFTYTAAGLKKPRNGMDQTPPCQLVCKHQVKGGCSPRGLTVKAGSTLTKQMQEGCFPHHCSSLSSLPKSMYSLMPAASSCWSPAFLPLLPGARILCRGRKALHHPAFILIKNLFRSAEHRGICGGPWLQQDHSFPVSQRQGSHMPWQQPSLQSNAK